MPRWPLAAWSSTTRRPRPQRSVALHTIRVKRSFDGREGRRTILPGTERDRHPVDVIPPRRTYGPPERYVDASTVTSKGRAASLIPRTSAAPATLAPASAPHLPNTTPPPPDRAAQHEAERAEAELKTALRNLRHLPNPIGPFQPDSNPWPAIETHRRDLIQMARNARRTLDGYRISQPEQPIGSSPASLARAARIAAAEAALKAHSGRSPQHGRV